MKRLILHVGLHKTATSSIQVTLDKNRAELNRQGFIYPVFKMGTKEINNHSIPLYSSFCKFPEKYHINIKNNLNDRIKEINEDYLSQLNRYLSMDANIIISGEDVSALHIDALTKLQQIFIANGFQLEVYCSVRRPYSFACSSLQERIKGGTNTLKILHIDKRSGVINKLIKAFGSSIHFSSFEKDCQSELGPVYAFIERVGVDASKIRVVNQNEGFGNLSTRMLSFLNESHPVIVNDALNPKGRGIFQNSIDDQKFLLTKTELQQSTKELDAENEEYLKLLGEDFCDQDYKTVDDVSINLSMALALVEAYTNEFTYIQGLIYVLKHRDFDVVDLIAKLPANADVFRDIAIRLKNSHDIALPFITAAKKTRPNGPRILALYEEIKQRSRI